MDKSNYFFESINNIDAERAEIINVLEEMNEEYPIPLKAKIDFETYLNNINLNGKIIVAKYNSQIIGFTTFYMNDFVDKEAAFSLLGVVKEHQKHGVAKKLFEESFIMMRAGGMKKVFSFTHKENKKGISFHKKLGFEIDENRVNDQEYNISLIKTL